MLMYYESINWAIDNNIDIIVGTTGFSRDELSAIERKSLKAKSKPL